MQASQVNEKIVSRYTNEDEIFWRQHFSHFAISGLKRVEYCQAQKISYGRFSYWLAKLAPTLPKKSITKKKSISKHLPLLPVQVKPEFKKLDILCSLTLKNGFTLQIHDVAALSFILEKVI
jgi:hypothetical protein